MNIRKHYLARLNRAYSICAIPSTYPNELPAIVAGSEGEGPLLFINPERPSKSITLKDKPGGFISLSYLQYHEYRYLFVVSNFFPGFKGEQAQILRFNLDTFQWEDDFTFSCPFTHRIVAKEVQGLPYLFLSTLCSGKANREDWSQPGKIRVVPLKEDSLSYPEPFDIVPNLTKNHGFEPVTLNATEGFLISCYEGLFWLPMQPIDLKSPWHIQPIAKGEYSDAFLYQNDQGQPVIFSISPFHGNCLNCHLPTSAGWETYTLWDDLAFAHVLWAGKLLGQEALIAGSRRNDMELRLYVGELPPPSKAPYQVIDKNVGGAQMTWCCNSEERAILAVTAQAESAVVLYEFTS